MIGAPRKRNLMQLKDLLLPLLAALWALCTLVLSGTHELNSIRDRIMFPEPIAAHASVAQREEYAQNDWLPLALLLPSACFAFGVIAICSPSLLDKNKNELQKEAKQRITAWLISVLVGVFAFLMTIVFIVTEPSDWRAMHEIIQKQTP
jgi:hypothetical protein